MQEDGIQGKRKQNSTVDLILQDLPHLKEYARQRSLVGLGQKRRLIKRFQKTEKLGLKSLAKASTLQKAQEILAKRNKDPAASPKAEDEMGLFEELPSHVVA